MSRKDGSSGIYVAGNWPAANVGSQQWTVRTSNGGDLQNLGWGDRFRDRAVVAIHRGQRVAVDFRSGRKYRRRARPFRVGLVLVLVLGLAPRNIVDDFENWWNNATNVTATLWNDVKNFIHGVVHTAVALLSGGLDLIDYAFTVATNAISAGLSWWINNVLMPVWDWVQNAATTVDGWINNAWNWFWVTIVAPAIGLVHDALNFAIDALQFAINEAAAGVSWLVDNIVTPVWDWIVGAAETVGGWINDAVQAFYHDVILPIWSDVVSAADTLASIFDWVWNHAVQAVELVYQAWDWLFWMAVHGFEDFYNLPEDILNGVSLKWAEQQAEGAADTMNAYAERIVTWFGG
jgi:hypothetical protein